MDDYVPHIETQGVVEDKVWEANHIAALFSICPVRPMKILRKIKIKYICLTLLVAFFVYGVFFYFSYKGFTHGLINQFRYATMAENKNLNFCVSYWLDFMEKLRFDEATGFYSFDELAQEYNDKRNSNDFESGTLAYHRGEFAQAITHIERDIDRNGESESKLFWLAMSYMRRAEAQNCLSKLIDHSSYREELVNYQHAYHDYTRLCSLPLTQFHDQTESSKIAAKLFETLLDNYDETNRLYQWLLNFCYMTVNAFPQDVPPKYRIQSRFIESFYGKGKNEVEAKYAYLSFEDRAKDLNVNTHDTGRGVAVEDFDKDGYLDIVTGGSFHVVRYYKNDRGLEFIDQTEAVGLGGIKQSFVITAADYDNDGWIDIFACRPFEHFMLFRNNQDGTFTDVTFSSGLLERKPDNLIAATWIPAWGDVDNDGDLDLFLAQWGFRLPFVKGLMTIPRMDSALFINENGHFVDKTKEYGLEGILEDQYYIGSTFGDFDADGYPDLFISSPLRNTSVLLRNISGERFEKTNLIRSTEPGFTAAFVDVNHDGRLDIFQGGFGDAKTNTAQTVFGENVDRYQSGHSTIHLQTQDGQFEERNDFFAGNMPMSTMGASYGDINNDGSYDFYLGTGNPEGWFVLPNLMYMGELDGTKPTGRMTNISMLHGFGTIQKGHGIVFFDFDEDGDQDIYSSLGGMWPGDGWPNQFFVNNSQLENKWVKIRLRGRQTNYFGVGCTIRVTAVNADGEEIIRYYHMDNKTGFGSAPYLAHIGLLDATHIEEVEVRWPVSKTTKIYKARLGQLNILDENEGTEKEVFSE